MKLQLTKYSDPSHGWLEVPLELLQNLGLIDKISTYSYVHSIKKLVYLEEDCDMHVFTKEIENLGWELEIKQIYIKNSSDNNEIRRLSRLKLYQPTIN